MRSAFNVGVLALASLVLAEDVHKVDVGEGGLVFNPSSVTAAEGDVVEFHFYPQKHSVAQGSFDKPCQVGSVTNGFYSGYIPSTSGESKTVFRVTVNSTDPMYFYCSQISHCQNGMVGAINPPSSGNTVEAYSKAAALTSDSETPASVQGGIVTTSSGDDDDDSSSSASSSATAAASSASSEAASSTASAASEATKSASSVESKASSVAATKTSAVGGAATSATSAASSAAASVTGNAAAGLGRVSLEMLGLAGLAGGVAVMMQ